MNIWPRIELIFIDALPVLGVVAGLVVVFWFANWLLLRRNTDMGAEARLPRQILLLVIVVIGLVLGVLLVPLSDATRGNILTLIGILLTGIIALSSTNFTGNIMAGLMLRVIRGFRSGDFIMIGDHFGRVTERGLVHTEIQNEKRNLITFPNLYLVTHPVTVVPGSGTIVAATLSLGYDIPRDRVEESLKRAAEAAGLKEPFVRVDELGNFAVTYRIAGLLEDVKHLLSARSDLRKSVMDALHTDGIEIVSPTIMDQRPLAPGHAIVPPREKQKSARAGAVLEPQPETLIFDKADKAETLERMREKLAAARTQVDDLKKSRKTAPPEESERIQERIDATKRFAERLAREIEVAEKKQQERDGSE